jgi:hypothetical protein
VGVIFAPIGGLLLYASSKVQEISIDYSKCTIDAPNCTDAGTAFSPIPSSDFSMSFRNNVDEDQQPTWCQDTQYISYGGNTNVTTPVCKIQFYVPEKLEAPVLLYYQLTNFYQNHRRYVKSFDAGQLNGEYRDNKTIDGSDCEPLQLGEDGKAYYPCGLIANSIFNDTIFSPLALNWPGKTENYTYEMKNTSIAWGADKELYKKLDLKDYPYGSVVPPMYWRERYPEYNETFPYPDLHTDEAFQVWMRTAGLPTFSKLARRNDNLTMEAGRYQVDVYDCKCATPRLEDVSEVLNVLTRSLRRLPRACFRRYEIHPPVHSHHHGWQEPLPRHRLRCSRRSMYCSRCALHSDALDQAQVCTSPYMSSSGHVLPRV